LNSEILTPPTLKCPSTCLHNKCTDDSDDDVDVDYNDDDSNSNSEEKNGDGNDDYYTNSDGYCL
jgi:hypothetical protein